MKKKNYFCKMEIGTSQIIVGSVFILFIAIVMIKFAGHENKYKKHK